MDTNVEETTAPQQAKPKRPAAVVVAAILLIVLALFVGGYGAATQLGLIRGTGARQFTPGQFRRGNLPPGGFQGNGGTNNFQGNGGTDGFQGNGGTGGFQGNAPGGGGNGIVINPGGGAGSTLNANRGGSFAGIARFLRVIRPVMIALDVLVLLLAIVAAVGLFMTKRWAAILSIVLAGLVILLTIPGMLRIFSSVVLVENLVRILVSLAIIVLLVLPSSRRSYSAARASGEAEEVERVVR